MTKNEIIHKYEKTIEEHFKDNWLPLIIPVFNSDYEGLIQSGKLMAQPPIFERLELTYEDWLKYLKTKEFVSDFDEILK